MCVGESEYGTPVIMALYHDTVLMIDTVGTFNTIKAAYNASMKVSQPLSV